MKPALEREIRERIEAFLSEISELVQAQALAAVQEVFGGEAVGRARAPSAGLTSARGARRTRRSPSRGREVGAEAVLDYVRFHEGERMEQIAAGLGTTTPALRAAVSELLGSRVLRTEGQRRGTRYFVRAAKARASAAPSATRGRRKPATIRAAPGKRAQPRHAKQPVEAPEVEIEPTNVVEPSEPAAQLEPSGAEQP